MKCPCCGKPIRYLGTDLFTCDACHIMLPAKHWLAYINTRKVLDIAVDALKEQQRWIGVIRVSMVSHLNDEKGTAFQHYDTDPTVLNISKAKVLLNKALAEITTLEQKDK